MNFDAVAEEWRREWEAWADEWASQLEERKGSIFAAIKEAGADEAVVFYDGSGDNGGITEIQLTKDSSLLDVPKNLDTLLSDFVWDYLETAHGGWELEAGACGEVTFDALEGTIFVVHNERYESYETMEDTF